MKQREATYTADTDDRDWVKRDDTDGREKHSRREETQKEGKEQK